MLSRLSQYFRFLGFGVDVKRPLVVCAAVCVAALGLLGCKGATLPATNINSTGAKLNLHGEADNGTAFSYFEYWQTAVPSLKSTTTVRNWPAGAASDFGESVKGLRQATSYSYRVCGNDSGKPASCINTRSFTTGVSGYSGIAHRVAPQHLCGRRPSRPGSPATIPAGRRTPPRSPIEKSGKLRVLDVASGMLGSARQRKHRRQSGLVSRRQQDRGRQRGDQGERRRTPLHGRHPQPVLVPRRHQARLRVRPAGDPVRRDLCRRPPA